MLEDVSQLTTMFFDENNGSMEIGSCFETPDHCGVPPFKTAPTGKNRCRCLFLSVCLHVLDGEWKRDPFTWLCVSYFLYVWSCFGLVFGICCISRWGLKSHQTHNKSLCSAMLVHPVCAWLDPTGYQLDWSSLPWLCRLCSLALNSSCLHFSAIKFEKKRNRIEQATMREKQHSQITFTSKKKRNLFSW